MRHDPRRFVGVPAVLALSVIGAADLAFADWDCERCRAEAAWWLVGGRAVGDDRWDSTTGRDLQNYAPDRVVDHRHMKLEIEIPDMNTPRFDAKQTLTVSPIGAPLETMSLDAEQLEVKSVQAVGGYEGKVTWTHDGSKLRLAFDPPAAPGQVIELRTDYAMYDPPDGLLWTPETSAWAERPAQLHTQGQPETNRFWFPSHDFPNERVSTEMVVTVPEGFVVSSNGRLVSDESSGGKRTFHWLQEDPHPYYLVSLVAGQFDIVDVGDGSLPMPVYVPPGKGALVEQTYGRTHEMIRVFEDRFGVEYPWDQYAQLVVWNFGAGGMENTSATTLYDTAILTDKALLDGDIDSLIAHELAHQWFGDLLTCKTWGHIWLNEGFATYGESLWFEARDGYQEGYLLDVWRNMEAVARRDVIDPDDEDAPDRPAMVSLVYEHPWEVFRRHSNPYPKGASILHMLRASLGDDVFFAGLQEYARRHQLQVVETTDLRQVFEEVSGRSLEQFFQQWAYRPGIPRVNVEGEWDPGAKQLTLTVEQTQRIDKRVPALAFTLPVHIRADGEERVVTIDVTRRRHERTISLPAEPEWVAVDPDLRTLKELELDLPEAWLIAQAVGGPSLAARLDAAQALAEEKSERVAETLEAILIRRDEPYALRAEAALSLGELGDSVRLVGALTEGIDDARVRTAIMDALAKVGDEAAVEALAQHAGDETESYATRAEALTGLGKVGDSSHVGILIEALDADSQHEQVRRAACSALGDLGEAEGLGALIEYSQLGWYQRLRPEAIAAIAKLAEHDPDLAFDTIAPLLKDRERRARRAAGAALVELEDERGAELLRRFAATSRDAEERAAGERFLADLRARLAKGNSTEELWRELSELRRELEALKK